MLLKKKKQALCIMHFLNLDIFLLNLILLSKVYFALQFLYCNVHFNTLFLKLNPAL